MPASPAPDDRPPETPSQGEGKGKLRGGFDPKEHGRQGGLASAAARRAKREAREAATAGLTDQGTVGPADGMPGSGSVDALAVLREVAGDASSQHRVAAARALLDADAAGKAERPRTVRELEALDDHALDQLLAHVQLAPLLPPDPEGA